MKKFAALLMSFAIALTALFCLASCSDETQNILGGKSEPSVEELLIGEWELISQTNADGTASSWKLEKVKFYDDGTCSVNGEMGTWKISGEELMVLGDISGRFFGSDSIVGKFSCDGETLEFYGAQIDAKDVSVDLVYKKI